MRAYRVYFFDCYVDVAAENAAKARGFVGKKESAKGRCEVFKNISSRRLKPMDRKAESMKNTGFLSDVVWLG